MKRVILAFDSFKGCASSQEIAASARQGIIDVFPECAVVVVPVADGGEGSRGDLLEYVRRAGIVPCPRSSYESDGSGIRNYF